MHFAAACALCCATASVLRGDGLGVCCALGACAAIVKTIADSLRIRSPGATQLHQCREAALHLVQTDHGASACVLDVVKAAAGQIFVHKVKVTAGCIRKGDQLRVVVDDSFRRRTRANHTATHLLQVRPRHVFV